MTTRTAKRLWALEAPTVTVDKSLLMIGLTGRVTLPYPCYLIEHRKGLVLFDTSLKPLAFEDPVAAYGPGAARFLDLSISPDMRIDRQLALVGYRTSDVTHVVLSHTHYDHCGGVGLFPRARFIVGKGELDYAYAPEPFGAGLFHREDLDQIRSFDWYEMPGADLDLFGDGSVTIIWTPGHTPGELSMLVRLPSRNLILTGDTVHIRDQLDTESPMPYDWDFHLASQAIRRLKLLSQDADATIWISHDMEDWLAFPHAPACVE
jgi:glyoxylase-like metal-dependent hydrolase (beta-lactamase superfamily II)